jgi:hypothetical protein
MIKFPLVQISWHDAWSDSGWKSPGEISNLCIPLVIHSVGYLVKTTRSGYLIAGSVDANGLVGSVMFRPRGMVKSMKRIYL